MNLNLRQNGLGKFIVPLLFPKFQSVSEIVTADDTFYCNINNAMRSCYTPKSKEKDDISLEFGSHNKTTLELR